MITLQDRIDVPAQRLSELRALLHRHYLPQALSRGMTLVDEGVSPPLMSLRAPVSVWLRWTLPDLGAWWAMRAGAGEPGVAAFWAEVDAIATQRERIVLSGDETLPEPEDVRSLACTPVGWRETAQLYLPDDPDASTHGLLAALLGEAQSELQGLVATSLEPNLATDHGGGHYTWDLLYRDRDVARQARAGRWWREELLPGLDRHCRARSALGLHALGAGARDPQLTGGVKRTALFRLLPGIEAGLRERFERDLLDMPAFISAIRNWRLSRAEALDWDMDTVSPWTYVWEQEFADLDGLTGPYMVHPHHWAHVDRWFDPESGIQVVDTALCHAFSPLPEAIITR